MADILFDTASDSGYTWIGRPKVLQAFAPVFDALFSGVILPFVSKVNLPGMEGLVLASKTIYSLTDSFTYSGVIVDGKPRVTIKRTRKNLDPIPNDPEQRFTWNDNLVSIHIDEELLDTMWRTHPKDLDQQGDWVTKQVGTETVVLPGTMGGPPAADQLEGPYDTPELKHARELACASVNFFVYSVLRGEATLKVISGYEKFAQANDIPFSETKDKAMAALSALSPPEAVKFGPVVLAGQPPGESMGTGTKVVIGTVVLGGVGYALWKFWPKIFGR